jgi:hypothetical protein
MKTYEVSYLIEADDNRFVNTEVVEASNIAEAFNKARSKGEHRYRESKCVMSESISHPDSIIKDISDIDFMSELKTVFAELAR